LFVSFFLSSFFDERGAANERLADEGFDRED